MDLWLTIEWEFMQNFENDLLAFGLGGRRGAHIDPHRDLRYYVICDFCFAISNIISHILLSYDLCRENAAECIFNQV